MVGKILRKILLLFLSFFLSISSIGWSKGACLQGEGERDLLARLVLAEGLSTGCPKMEPVIFKAIAWGTLNRVRLAERSQRWEKKFGRGVRGVIFHPGQFNPAVSKKSPFSRLFLCPEGDEQGKIFWPWALEAADTALKGPIDKNPFLETDWEKKNQLSLVAHFYYPKSSQATSKPPVWTQSQPFLKNVIIDNVPLPTDCLWFFRLEREVEPVSKKVREL